jgi:hypothetical protein
MATLETHGISLYTRLGHGFAHRAPPPGANACDRHFNRRGHRTTHGARSRRQRPQFDYDLLVRPFRCFHSPGVFTASQADGGIGHAYGLFLLRSVFVFAEVCT